MISCSAIKKDGKTCSNKAKFEGFCGIHKIRKKSYTEEIICNLPSSIIGVVLSFDDTPLIRALEISFVSHKCRNAINTHEAFVPCLPDYILKDFSKDIGKRPLEKFKIWRDTYQICSNLYCPALINYPAKCSRSCERICKSTAKKLYSLSEKDLSNLPFASVVNPIYRSGSPMMLFCKCVVRRASFAKYGGLVGLKEHLESNRRISNKRKKTRQENEEKKEKNLTDREAVRLKELSEMSLEQRKELILLKLEQYGLTWRDDSRLLPSFIKNPNITDNHVIALLLMTRDFFYIYGNDDFWTPNFTLYSDHIKIKMRKYMLEHDESTWIEAYVNSI